MSDKILSGMCGVVLGIILCVIDAGFGGHVSKPFAQWETWRIVVSGACALSILACTVRIVTR